MLVKIFNHPRVVAGFYSSMMTKNIENMLIELLPDELVDVRENMLIFGREYNTEMAKSKYYEKLAENPWDTYRNLQKIFEDSVVAAVGFNQDNTLMIDSESEKVQLWLQNSLVVEQYTKL